MLIRTRMKKNIILIVNSFKYLKKNIKLKSTLFRSFLNTYLLTSRKLASQIPQVRNYEKADDMSFLKM